MGSSLGKIFQVTSFGESHGPVIGILIDGCPAGLMIDIQKISKELERRKPGQNFFTTPRQENENFEILSGVFQGKSTGAPICMILKNQDVDSSEYEKRRFTPRPGHADYTAFAKYGGFEDYRGGGRFSARITAGFVMAGSIAKQLLDPIGIKILAHTISIGDVVATKLPMEEIEKNVEKTTLFCADLEASEKMIQKILRAKEEGDSLGGVIEGIALNLPVGLGEPVIDNLDGELAKALFALPAVKGVSFGSGFEVAKKRGSEVNDPFFLKGGKIKTLSNYAGGILGGLSNGEPLTVQVAFKPISSISKTQQTVDLKTFETVSLKTKGRFDPCPIPRAIPMVEAMMAIVLADLCLRAGKLPRIRS